MKPVKVHGVSFAVPNQIVTNDDLALKMDTSDEWIYSRTGIKARRIAEKETTSGLATEAAIKVLKSTGIDPAEIDLILVATSTPESLMPATACVVQNNIGATQAAAVDMVAACSGFAYAVNTGYQYIATGMYQKVLVIGAETMSTCLDWSDRSTCVLFGDGAGAMLLGISEEPGILSMDLGANGKLSHALQLNPTISMNGQEVFKFAVKIIPQVINNLVERACVNVQDLDYIIIHQANIRMVEPAAKRLGIDEKKFFMNIEKYGNTSAASIPIALAEMDELGLLQRGQLIALVGFGGGLTWGGTLIRW